MEYIDSALQNIITLDVCFKEYYTTVFHLCIQQVIQDASLVI